MGCMIIVEKDLREGNAALITLFSSYCHFHHNLFYYHIKDNDIFSCNAVA